MPVVAALAAGGEEADELRRRSLLGTDDPEATPPAHRLDAGRDEGATYLVEACGGREWTAVRAKANLDAALGALERVRLSAMPHRELADLAVYVVERGIDDHSTCTTPPRGRPAARSTRRHDDRAALETRRGRPESRAVPNI